MRRSAADDIFGIADCQVTSTFSHTSSIKRSWLWLILQDIAIILMSLMTAVSYWREKKKGIAAISEYRTAHFQFLT